MARNITYKPVSKDLEKMVKPTSNSSMRPSLGLEEAVGEYFYISVDDLVPFHNQARQNFDEEEISSLAESIKIHGIRQPLTVMPSENNKFEVISGERRLRAAKKCNLLKVPCIIIKDIKQADAIALVENIHRKDLHPIELGITYKNLLDTDTFISQTDLAEKISVTKSHISEHLKYAEFHPDIQKHIIENKILARDKLREIINANSKGDTNKIRQLLGMNSSGPSTFSILRITSTHGEMKFQERGVQQLSITKKQELKKYLSQLMQRI